MTDEQVAALCAYVAGDLDNHRRLLRQLDREAAATGYSALISASFCRAVEQRFTRNRPADVAEFVASVRARSEELGEKIDPRTAERLIRAVYTDEQIRDIDREERISLQILLLAALIVDQHLYDAALEDFLVQARKLADEWLK